MRGLTPLSVISTTLLFFTLTIAKSLPIQIHILSLPSSSTPSPYLSLNIDTTNTSLTSITAFRPPKPLPETSALVRIGTVDGRPSDFHTSILTRGSAFQDGYTQVLTVYLGAGEQVAGLGFRAKKTSQGEGKGEGEPVVEVVKATEAQRPVLEKPVELTPDGKLPEKEVEKTFLQKYWWLLLGAFVFAVAGGGDK